MLGVLVILNLLFSPLGGGGGACTCEPDNECRGSCAGESVTACATPLTGGDVQGVIHICSLATGCSIATSNHPDTSVERMSLCKGGCKVTIAPVQGKDWGDIDSCDDLTVHCGEC
jgi:hypothetical protein